MYDTGLGLGWITIGFLGFAIGIVLAKIKILNDNNSAAFCTWASTIPAAVLALSADSSTDSGAINFLGRLAIFGIVWLVFGLVFSFGVAMGMDKSK